MKPKIITLFEHQAITYQELGWERNDPHITQLEQLISESKIPIFTFGRDSLKASQYIGIVRLGGLTFQILPKIDYQGNSDNLEDAEPRRKAVQSASQNLLRLLSYTHDIQLRARDTAALKEQPSDWFELLTRLFARELFTQLRSGLEHTYIYYEDTLPVIRGRWEISRQLTVHPHVFHRFDVSFDEYSPDTPLNQVFRFVAQRLIHVTVDAQNRRYLREIRDWLDHIPPPEVPIQSLLQKIHFSRLNERFRLAYNLARLFLESLAFQLSTGGQEVFAFVLDMNRLFEEFIGEFLIHHWRSIEIDLIQDVKIILQSKGKQIFLAEPANPAGRPVFPLIPDILFTRGARPPRLIGDTKYKQLTPNTANLGVAEGDIYQMLAYSLRFDCPQLLLLYPQSSSGRVHTLFKVPGQIQTVTISTLNLHTPLDNPAHLIKELQEILSPLLMR